MSAVIDGTHPVSILGIIDEIARRNSLESSSGSFGELDAHFDRITRLATELFGVESTSIALIDHEMRKFGLRARGSLEVADATDPFHVVTRASVDVLTVRDAMADPRFSDHPRVNGAPHVRFYAGYRLESSGGEWLGTLSIFDPHPRVFTDSEKTLLRDLALLAQNKLTIVQELNRAAEVQGVLLPQKLLSLPGYQVAGACLAARSVGGDFYDWYPVGEGAAFTLADVMGKGIGAAIIAATVRAVLRSGSRHRELAASVEAAAAILETDLDQAGTFVTLFHARLDMDTGMIRYIDAGHGLSLVVRADGGVKRLATTSLPLGAGTDTHWNEHRVTLEPGDTLVSLSDGVLDLYDGTLASLDDVEQLVRDAPSAQAVVDGLMDLAARSAPDDVTAIVLRRDA